MTRKTRLQRSPQRATLGIMKFPTEREEFAWAVGIFEGEGSFIRGGSKPWYSLQIKLGMTDEDVLRKACAILGLKVTGPEIQPNRKPLWRATKGGPEARATIHRMLPYLGARRRARAIELLSTITGKRGTK